MNAKAKKRAIAALFLTTAVVGAALFTKSTVAQSNTNTLSGVFGCTMRDDRWGRTPEAGNNYDVSGLVWVLDASRSKASGIDMRYAFATASSGVGQIQRQSETIYKDEPVVIENTELINVYKMNIDNDGHIYLVATNGGNTLLVSGASSRNWVSQSGICQKM